MTTKCKHSELFTSVNAKRNIQSEPEHVVGVRVGVALNVARDERSIQTHMTLHGPIHTGSENRSALISFDAANTLCEHYHSQQWVSLFVSCDSCGNRHNWLTLPYLFRGLADEMKNQSWSFKTRY